MQGLADRMEGLGGLVEGLIGESLNGLVQGLADSVKPRWESGRFSCKTGIFSQECERFSFTSGRFILRGKG